MAAVDLLARGLRVAPRDAAIRPDHRRGLRRAFAADLAAGDVHRSMEAACLGLGPLDGLQGDTLGQLLPRAPPREGRHGPSPGQVAEQALLLSVLSLTKPRPPLPFVTLGGDEDC